MRREGFAARHVSGGVRELERMVREAGGANAGADAGAGDGAGNGGERDGA